jgi:hypothetical protein
MFVLDFDSEIVFVGDAGTTEASRPSRRVGAEYTLHAKLLPWLTLDLDASYTRRDSSQMIPPSPAAASRGPSRASLAPASPLNVGRYWVTDYCPLDRGNFLLDVCPERRLVRPTILAVNREDCVRVLSPQPLSSVRMPESNWPQTSNLLNQEASQIDYFYGSRVASEPGEVEDVHIHPLEPRSFRLSLTQQW